MLLEQSGCVQLVQWRASKWTPAVVLGTRRLWCYWSNLDVRLVRWRVSKWPPAAVFGAEGCFPWRLYRYADCLFLQVAVVWMYLLYVQMCVESSFKGVVRLWWVPLQLAAVWVPLERHEISVHGAVVVCSSSTSSHVGTSGKFLFFLSRLHLLLFLHLVQLFWKKISLRWGRSPRFSMVLLTSQNGVAAPSHLPENDAFFSPAPLFLIHEPLPPTLHPSLLVSLFFLFLKISFP